MIWNRPEDFKLLALANVMLVGVGTAVFALWQRKGFKSDGQIRYEEIAMNDAGGDEIIHDDDREV